MKELEKLKPDASYEQQIKKHQNTTITLEDLKDFMSEDGPSKETINKLKVWGEIEKNSILTEKMIQKNIAEKLKEKDIIDAEFSIVDDNPDTIIKSKEIDNGVEDNNEFKEFRRKEMSFRRKRVKIEPVTPTEQPTKVDTTNITNSFLEFKKKETKKSFFQKIKDWFSK